MSKPEIQIPVHFVTDIDGTVYLEIKDVIELIDYTIAGVVCGKLDVQDLIQQLKEMANED